jgi:hypothetical protein
MGWNVHELGRLQHGFPSGLHFIITEDWLSITPSACQTVGIEAILGPTRLFVNFHAALIPL